MFRLAHTDKTEAGKTFQSYSRPRTVTNRPGARRREQSRMKQTPSHERFSANPLTYVERPIIYSKKYCFFKLL